MFFAVASGQTGNQDGFKLHGIEMTPFLFGSMIVDTANVPADRTLGFLAEVLEINRYLLVADREPDVPDVPGRW